MQISLHRLQGYILRHFYEAKASIDRKVDIIFWPTIDLLTFGLLTVYIDRLDVKAGLASAIIGGLILWTLVYNIQRDISVSILEEAWSRNIFNLFSSPITIGEVIIGTLILSSLKAIFTVIFITSLAIGLFHFNLLSLGPLVVYYIFSIFLFGWAFGYITAGLIFRFGARIQTVAWSLIAIIYPISGVFYPISTLPSWLATLSKGLPLSYIFEGLRNLIVNGAKNPAYELALILILNGIYLLIGILVYKWGFESARERGWFIHPT